jgi:hypothetical protein
MLRAIARGEVSARARRRGGAGARGEEAVVGIFVAFFVRQGGVPSGNSLEIRDKIR